MGLSLIKNCCLYPKDGEDGRPTPVFAPNPNPINFKILLKHQFKNAHVLLVHYPDCTNFEGKKIMVCMGQFKETDNLDPHFRKIGGPIARFIPTQEGMALAIKLAKSL